MTEPIDLGNPNLMTDGTWDAQVRLAQGANCRKCFEAAGGTLNVRMFLCEHCGNKRCPHATDCKLECTHSNEPGQKGSAYA